VIITAVDKTSPENLKLKFFGNHPDIDEDYQSREFVHGSKIAAIALW